jgi:nicotinamide-nucleotide amidase
MRAEIVAIGAELLLGFVVNSDTAYLGRVLAGLGVDCYFHVTVGDNPKRLAETLQTALSRADCVITCGGLGPTVDDITLETVARVTGKPLVAHPEILRKIRARFARLGIRMPKSNARQALLPQGAIPFANDVGTAPGFLLKVRSSEFGVLEKLLVALPGPPAELIPMVEKRLIPRLRRFTGGSVIRSKTLKVTGLTESEVDAKVRDLLALKGKATLGIYAHPAQVDLRITAKASSPSAAKRLIAGVEAKIRRRLGPLIFGTDEEALEGAVGKLLKVKKLTLGLAESCTGGLLGHRITEVPGSSDYFLGGVVTYANELKKSSLGVPEEFLKRFGAVSPQVARAMAQGVRRFTGSDLGLAITGIAGPAGGNRKKPVGLVYIALSISKGTKVFRYLFSGDRSTIKFKASQAALDLLRCALLSR